MATSLSSTGARATLLETDWNREWMELQEQRRKPDDPAFWNKRARHFKPRETHPYAQDFIARMAVRPHESILDMGCGAGSLAIPLAQAGHRVIAADFSNSMLDALTKGIAHYNLERRIVPKHLAWDDNWEDAGIKEQSVDIAIASRSIATANLQAALEKLDRCARRRCCITLVANASPRFDTQIMNAIGASVTHSCDYIYAFAILVRMGRLPEVSYIDSPRRDTFDSLEEGLADFSRMLEGGNEEKYELLRSYLAKHMVENPDAGQPGPKDKPQGRYMLDHERIVHWAFLSWNTAKAPA